MIKYYNFEVEYKLFFNSLCILSADEREEGEEGEVSVICHQFRPFIWQII